MAAGQPGLLQSPPKHQPLNLYWSKVDSNGIPMNPQWGWQREHTYGSPKYYPDIPWLTPLLQLRNFYVFGYAVKKLGEERDFSKAITQPTFKEYGGNYIPMGAKVPVPGVCGPHINWTQPVTYEGVLQGAGYDGDDGDVNFYIYTPQGAGAVKRTDSHKGGIKIEFNSKETVDHFHTPWWSKFNYDGDQTNGKYAMVTGLFGLDCAHECDSEVHPAWTMAIRAKDNDPGDEMWAIFARNWGNEGYCSDHIFTADFPQQQNKHIYKFSLPWRVGAKSVTVTKSEFLQKGGVGMNVTPIPNKAVVVSFVLPPPAQRARVNGQLHLRWEGCPLPCQAYVPGTAIGNAKVASKTLVLEDTEMNRRIMQQLPGEKRQLYGRVLQEMRTKTPSPVADTLRPFGLSARDVERTVRGLPSVRITPDADKRRHKQEVLYRLKINPQQLEMRPMEGMTPMEARPMEPAAPMAAHPMERVAPEQIRELPAPSEQVTPSVQERR